MRLFGMPSPAISKALARVATRQGATALCAHFVKAFRSCSLKSIGAAGAFMRKVRHMAC